MSRRHAHTTKNSQICIVQEARRLLLFTASPPEFRGVDHVVMLTYGVVSAPERNKDLGSFRGIDI